MRGQYRFSCAEKLNGDIVAPVKLEPAHLLPTHLKSTSPHVALVLTPMLYANGREAHGAAGER